MGGGGRGVGAHKRGVSDVAFIAFASNEEAKAVAFEEADAANRALLKPVGKSQSDSSFGDSSKDPSSSGIDKPFKSADPLSTSTMPTGLVAQESPNSVTAIGTSAIDNTKEDKEVEKINSPVVPIQPISISARAPVVKSSLPTKPGNRNSWTAGASDKNAAAATSTGGSALSPKMPGGGSSSSLSGKHQSMSSRGGAAEDLDGATIPSAATLKKLNRRPSSNSLTALLAAEAAANGAVVNSSAVTALTEEDGEVDGVCGAVSAWMRRSTGSPAVAGSGTSERPMSVAIDKGTVEKLRNSFAGPSASMSRCLSEEAGGAVNGSPPAIPRPPRARWTPAISSSAATLAITSTSGTVARPENVVKKFTASSSLSTRSSGSSDEAFASSGGGIAISGPSVSNDIANRCAAVLKMDKATFLALPGEGPIGGEDRSGSGSGDQRFSFVELVRRNFTKEYQGLIQSDLEKYLQDEEFVTVFQKNKVSATNLTPKPYLVNVGPFSVQSAD